MAVLILAVSGCSGDPMSGGDAACTASFAIMIVKVVDGGGRPVPDASVTATLLRTGQVLVPTTLALSVPGTYVLVDDGSTHLIRRSGDAVQAQVSRGGVSITADYVFNAPGGCHINKVSGPDTVTLP